MYTDNPSMTSKPTKKLGMASPTMAKRSQDKVQPPILPYSRNNTNRYSDDSRIAWAGILPLTLVCRASYKLKCWCRSPDSNRDGVAPNGF